MLHVDMTKPYAPTQSSEKVVMRRYYDVMVGTGPEVKKGDRIAVHYDAKWKNITFMTSRCMLRLKQCF